MITQEQVKDRFRYKNGELLCRKQNKPVGAIDSSGYLRISVDGKTYSAQRLIYLYFKGYLPDLVDHIDLDRTNNKIVNLRECTRSQNQHNTTLRKDNKSGVKGVCWCNRWGKWLARIKVNGESVFVGYFDDLKKAEQEVTRAREKAHGIYARQV